MTEDLRSRAYPGFRVTTLQTLWNFLTFAWQMTMR